MVETINEFYQQCQALNGKVMVERAAWNDEASAQAIRHFSICVADDNPLWIDKEYAVASPNKCITAPPAFITSIKYPLLHGAKMQVPMSNLANRLEVEWFKNIFEGDRLTGTLRQTGVTRGKDRRGREVIYLETEGTYTNHREELVCKSKGIVAWVAKHEEDKKTRSEWKIHSYTKEEIDVLAEAILNRKRTGNQKWPTGSLVNGVALPDLVHPPLTTGDITCWEAANGPAYRAGNLGFKDAHAKPLTTVLNPVTGWRVNRAQSHGDHLLAHSRDMPGPFDSGVMRFAWVTVFVTDWMGDWATLKRLRVNVVAPLLYGDAMTVSGRILATAEGILDWTVDILLEARNQRNEVISTGEAQVVIPNKAFEDQQSPYELLMPNSSTSGEKKPWPPLAVELFSACVLEYPTRIAVSDDRESHSFLKLDKIANQLANHLIHLGANKNIPVAVMLPRGSNWILSALAVQKAGAIYVPIDPAQPKERIVFMLRESQSRIVITEIDLFGETEQETLKVVQLARDQEVIRNYPQDPFHVSMDRHAMAYVMFTSGSTGWPKGVAITHHALALYMESLKETLVLETDDVYLNTATFSFSASIRQTFYPLTRGITQVVANDAQRIDPLRLAELIEREGITVWDTVPSAWGQAMNRLMAVREHGDTNLSLKSIRQIMLTGEALHWRLPRLWWKQFNPATRVINLYSQTETTGSVAYCPLTKDDPQATDSDTVPLGFTFPDMEVRLLDEDALHPASDGAKGEICVFSDRLAAGYLNSSLHEEKFLNLPGFEGKNRYYKTGDLAIMDAESKLKFAGRSDRRVKIRGFRVDLGEVESAISEFSGVREFAVIAQRTEGSDIPSGLLAAVVFDEVEDPIDPLREHLSNRLPEYMVPSRIVSLRQLPRMQSGKLDPKALNEAIIAREENTSNFVLPRNAEEESIYTIWQKVLGHKSFSVTDDFFDLGGDSLSALTLVSEIEKVFERTVPLDAIFEKTTIEGLANSLKAEANPEDAATDTAKTELEIKYPEQFRKLVALVSGRKGKRLHSRSLIVTITPDTDTGKRPLFFCANGREEAESMAKVLGPEQPLYFVESGFVVINRTDSIIRALALHHLPDILELYPNGPFALLGYSFGCTATMILAEQLKAMNREISFLGLLDGRIGPGRLYRWYFKQIDRKILRHFYGRIQADNNLSKKESVGRLLLHGIGHQLGLIKKTQKASEPLSLLRLATIETPFRTPDYPDPIWLFRATGHTFRNLIFPRAGFPKGRYPKLKIIQVPGDHNSTMTDSDNLETVGKEISVVLEKTGIQSN